MFDGEKRRDLVVLQDNFALWVEDEADVKETILDLRMASFGLSDDKRVVGASDLAKRGGLLTGDIDRAFSCKLDVIEVEHLIIEALQGSFGKGDQSDRQIETGEPGGSFDEMGEVFDVALNVGAGTDATYGRNESNGG